ncbi:MAG TPA: hypothetical protein VIX18_12755, partial [Nitrospirota bacterium]
FIVTLIDLPPERCLFFQNPPDFSVKAGNPASHPLQMSGDACGLRNSLPEEFIRFQFPQLAERIADIPQEIETPPVRGKRFQLCVNNAQLAFQRLLFLPGLLDPFVQLRQFL